MITEFFIDLTCGIVAGFLSLMPQASLDLSGLEDVGNIIGRVGPMNEFFPVVTLGACLGLVLAVKFYMLGYHLVMFVYHQFWGSS